MIIHDVVVYLSRITTMWCMRFSDEWCSVVSGGWVQSVLHSRSVML